MLNIIEINDVYKLESLRDQERESLNEANIRNPFSTCEWIITWWRHFGKQNQLVILVIEENGKTSVIAPLMIKKTSFGGLPMIKVQFIGTGEANYLDFISSRLTKETLVSILEYIKKRHKWNIIDLTDINQTSFSLSVFRDRALDNFCFSILESEVCPYVSMQADWEDYFHSKLKRKSRYNIQRQIKQLQSRGRLEFKRMNQSDDWGFFIRKAIKLYQKDWKKKYNISSFLKDEYAGFYIDIAKEFSNRGWFDFSSLTLDEEMIAFSYGITYKDRFIDYLIGYDPAFSEFSPGSCLLRFQLEEMFRQNLKEFDFSKGQEPYKSRWKTGERKNYRIIISNNDFYSKLIWFAYIIHHRIRYGCKGIYSLRKLRKHILGRFRS